MRWGEGPSRQVLSGWKRELLHSQSAALAAKAASVVFLPHFIFYMKTAVPQAEGPWVSVIFCRHHSISPDKTA